MKKLIAIIMTLTLASCAVSKTKLSEEGMKIKVINLKPRKNCHAIKKVIGINDEGVLDLAINHARNLAGKAGATTLFIEEKVNNSQQWRVHATAYTCKK